MDKISEDMLRASTALATLAFEIEDGMPRTMAKRAAVKIAEQVAAIVKSLPTRGKAG